MQYEIFSVPLLGGEETVEAMNKFIGSHKVVHVEKEFTVFGEHAFWTFCVCYLPQGTGTTISSYPGGKRGEVDYRDVLEPEAFNTFSRLRDCRKQIAEREAVPAYAVFTNAELAKFAQADKLNAQTILSVEGIGKKRLQKYGLSLLNLYENITKNENLQEKPLSEELIPEDLRPDESLD